MKKRFITSILTVVIVLVSSISVFADSVTIVKNGNKIDENWVWTYMNGSEPYFQDTATDVMLVFPDETMGANYAPGYGYKIPSPVRRWAEMFGYNFRIEGNTVYLDKESAVPETPPEQIPEETTQREVTVWVNGKEVIFPDQKPVIVNDRTLIPVRAVMESLNCKVEWTEQIQSVVISNSFHAVGLYIGKSYYYWNGTKYPMDVAPTI